MAGGLATSVELVRAYQKRIAELDRDGPRLRSVLELNPDAEEAALELDRERRERGPRGPLHGVPILVKDNIDTAGPMLTTAGSLALEGAPAGLDATVVARLRSAGAVLLGKTNLSEWANLRSTRSSSGWSARGGQTRNPHLTDRTPCGSSSGSAVAVAASLGAAALGTETDGSVVCPSSTCGVVGIKPTVGATSRAGVIPTSQSQDTVGVHGRTVADAATLLSAIMGGVDPRDPATGAAPASLDLSRCLRPGALRGARLGVARNTFTGYSEHTDRVFEAALEVLRSRGAEVVDPADIATAEQIRDSESELTVLLYEFKAGLDAYLGARSGIAVHNLAGLIDFNFRNADREMPYFRQEYLEAAAEKGPLTDPAYLEARATALRLARSEGLDEVFGRLRLDALVAPTGAPAWTIDLLNGDRYLGASSQPAAIAGYPLVTVPAGMALGLLPVGLTFMGRAWSEPDLIAFALDFETAAAARRPPGYLPGLPAPD